MRRIINGVEQFCCLCGEDAARRKVADLGAYDVDCTRCGSYRIGRGGEHTMSRSRPDHRNSVAQQVRAANQNGLIIDLITGDAFGDDEGRLSATPRPENPG